MTAFIVATLLALGFAMSRIRRKQWWKCLRGHHLWRARWEQYPSQHPSMPFHFSHSHMVAWCDECGQRTCLTLTGDGLAWPFGYADRRGEWAPGFDPEDPANVKDMGRPWDQADADNPRWEVVRGKGPW